MEFRDEFATWPEDHEDRTTRLIQNAEVGDILPADIFPSGNLYQTIDSLTGITLRYDPKPAPPPENSKTFVKKRDLDGRHVGWERIR